jgi:hypothetical protein
MVIRSSHWLSDVIAGACVGMGALCTVGAIVVTLKS